MSVSSGSMLRSATSDEETSTDKDPNSIVLVYKPRHPALLWTVFVFFLLIIWGVSLLPAVFFLITYKDQDDKPKLRYFQKP